MLLTALLGAVIGVVLALTGAGGGSLAVPLLVLVLHLPMQQAAPMGLVAVGLAAGLGALLGLRQGVVRYRAALLMGGLGMLAAPVGVTLSQHLPQRLLLVGFGLLLGGLALRQLWPSKPEASTSTPHGPPCLANPDSGRLVWTSPCARAIAGTGAFSGFLSGLIGVGGGFVMVPALSRYTDLNLRAIQATSLAVMALVALSAVGSAAWQGTLAWPAALPLAAGAVAALLAGRPLAARLPTDTLRQVFAWVSLIVAALVLLRAAGWLAVW